jgi:hypothetical protein
MKTHNTMNNEDALRFAAEKCLGWRFIPPFKAFECGGESKGTYAGQDYYCSVEFWRPDQNPEQMALLWKVIRRLGLQSAYARALLPLIDPGISPKVWALMTEEALYDFMVFQAVSAENEKVWQAFVAIIPAIEAALERERVGA